MERLLRLHGDPGVLRERKVNGRPGLLDLGPSTWYALVADGKAPSPIKIGRSCFWLESDIAAFIDRAKQKRGAR